MLYCFILYRIVSAVFYTFHFNSEMILIFYWEGERTEVVAVNSPRSGTYSDVFGTFSATSSRKTENERRTVIPRETFSPESGGR